MSTSSRSSALGPVLLALAVAATVGVTIQLWQQQRRRSSNRVSEDNDVPSNGDAKRQSAVAPTDADDPAVLLLEEKTVRTSNTSRSRSTLPQPLSNGDAEKVPMYEIHTTKQTPEEEPRRILSKNTITIVHGSVTGTCSRLAQELFTKLNSKFHAGQNDHLHMQLGKVDDFDWWDELLNAEEEDDHVDHFDDAISNGHTPESPQSPPILLILLSTYTQGTWPPNAVALQTALEEMQNDWRVEKRPLQSSRLQVSVYGMGSSEYQDFSMGKPAREAYQSLLKLGAQPLFQKGAKAINSNGKKSKGVWIGDDATPSDQVFADWCQEVATQLEQIEGIILEPSQNGHQSSSCDCKTNGHDSKTECCQNNSNGNSHTTAKLDESDTIKAEESEGDFDDDDEEEDDDDDEKEPEVMDLEDLGDSLQKPTSGTGTSSEPREMVTPSQAAALKKEGYKLIGSHSAVKLCRWTKHQLRGRGGCYKHTFYGITSYQCMEATPSLACANKCKTLQLIGCAHHKVLFDLTHTCCNVGVFCWRHHKNPVGKEWRWKTDDPNFIVDEAVKTHIRMIVETKGIPGVRMDRWQEAHTVRHCALSLVGEPIMYPRINELLQALHSRKISTFLVTNGQHPKSIETLLPITQLYVSVDAPTPESLIAIDRPLFSDAWDRLKQSLSSLKAKGQRTVARLTVVKGWNSDEVDGYAKLIALGHVSLVEVKGVTFCGKSDASNLNMSNTPWHHEVVELTQTLRLELDRLRSQKGYHDLPEYDLACEHKHSCSVLLARVDQFAVDNPATGKRTWKTWIDYNKFHALASRVEEDPSFSFQVEDYTAETPAWALFGASEEGFDPTDTRHRKEAKIPKYTKFDERGIPTHDHYHKELSNEERAALEKLMKIRIEEIGSGSTVTEMKDGAKQIEDASLMFRGLVVGK